MRTITSVNRYSIYRIYEGGTIKTFKIRVQLKSQNNM